VTHHSDANLINRIEERQDEKLLRRKMNAAFAVAFLLTVLLSSLSWRTSRRAAEDADWVAHTHEVSTALEVTLRHLVDVETGARGFALTGHQQFLEPYETGKYGVSQDLPALSALTVDGDQKIRLTSLVERANAAILADSELVAFRRNSGTVPSVAQLEHGKEVMDALRVTVDTMEVGRKRLLEQRTGRARAAQRLSISAIWMASGFGIFVLFIAAVAVDREIRISARARAHVNALNTDLESRVEQSERLSAVIDSSEDAIIAKDLTGKIKAWNRGAEKVFGYSASETIGKSMLMLFPPERVNEESDILERIRRGESVENFETIRVRKDGTSISISTTISPIRDSGGAIVGVSKIARDITERKSAEEALRQSDARRGFALEAAKLGDWELDLAKTQAERSLLHDRIFGYASLLPEWSFDIFLHHVHPDDREWVRENFMACISQARRWDFECRIVWPNGDIRWIWACGSHYHDLSRDASRMFGIVEDITERKLAEEELRESEARFRLFVEHAPAALAMFDTKMRYLHASNRWRDDYSLGDRDLRGISHYEVFPEVPERWKEAHRRGLAGQVLRGEKDRFDRSDHSVQWIRWEIRPWFDRTGGIGGVVIFTEDITERTNAEVALRDSEQRFQTMLNGIPQLAWMAKADGSLFWYNQRWYEYTGTTSEQMEGWGWQSVHDSEFLPKVLERWKASIAAGTAFEMEFPLRAADGSFGTFLTRVVPLKDADCRVVRWFGTNTDISERARAEQGLAVLARELSRRAEELASSRQALEAQTVMFKLVLDSMGEGLIAADLDGHFLIFNDAAHDLMGRGPEDLPTEQWTPHYRVFLPDGITPYPPDRLPLVRALRGESVQVELIVQSSEARSMEVTACPVRDARGELCGGVAVLHDITERKRSEKELAQKAQELLRSREALEAQTLMLQSVLDSMVEGLVAADENGKFILWNPAAEKIVGLSAANVPPEEWSAHYCTYLPDMVTLFPPEQNPLLRAIRGEVSTALMFLSNPELNRAAWIESNGAPLRDKDGVVRGGVVAFRDITQRKADELEIWKLNEHLEQRIAERTAQLEAANKELEAFSYSVAHDLRAPLRHVDGFSKILAEHLGSSLDKDAQHYLESIQDSTRNMGNMVDEMLNLSRVARMELNLRVTGLSSLVEEVLKDLEPELRGRDIEWKIGVLPFVECDPVLTKQVFVNLLSNAVKFTRTRRRAIIEVGQRDIDGQSAIYIRDNGVGFSMKYSGKLFGVFQRLHRQEDFEGTGVGLATVQRIVQKHGGRVWAEAELNTGATFYFTLETEIQTAGLIKEIIV
jgi:PAS domain S-box-containing protein